MKRRSGRETSPPPERTSRLALAAALWPVAVLAAYLAHALQVVAPVLLGGR